MTNTRPLLFTASYITGAHHAESLSLDGAVRALARMLGMNHTELHTEQMQYQDKACDMWFVYAPGECVGTIRCEAW